MPSCLEPQTRFPLVSPSKNVLRIPLHTFSQRRTKPQLAIRHLEAVSSSVMKPHTDRPLHRVNSAELEGSNQLTTPCICQGYQRSAHNSLMGRRCGVMVLEELLESLTIYPDLRA